MDQQKVPSPMFSFRLSKTGSELYLGGANANKYALRRLIVLGLSAEIQHRYTGAIEWSPITSRSYWLIKGAPLVNGKAINGDVNKRYNMAIDSGTTVILAPTADATAFWKLVPGAAPFSGDSSYWTYPCRSPPQVGQLTRAMYIRYRVRFFPGRFHLRWQEMGNLAFRLQPWPSKQRVCKLHWRYSRKRRYVLTLGRLDRG